MVLGSHACQVGLFLGLTGANCNAKTHYLLSLAEYTVASDEYQKEVVDALSQADWQSSLDGKQEISLHDVANQALSRVHHTDHLAESNVLTHFASIQKLVNQGSMYAIDQALKADCQH